QLQTPLHHIQPGLNLHPHATTQQKQPFTNPLQHILSKPTQHISHQTTNPQIPTLKNTPLQQLKPQPINPLLNKNPLQPITELVNNQIQII
ncbi:DUF1542 domain-containing protein, partial [Staphylococcus aureus]|uniref:DUF1542 domain-containing protein n=1 Tax=Staphylococcus aureus TaxID=1280 RepID=UPI00119EA201